MSRTARLLTATLAVLVVIGASPAWACGFLVAENGAIRLDTFTAAAVLEDDGTAHYVTAFSFDGSPESFGAVIPLPDIPTEVERAPDWFLQRLAIETSPQVARTADAPASAALEDAAVVVATYEVDALDIAILEGGGAQVLEWADANGFDLGVADGDLDDRSDAVAMLDFYGLRSPYFAALKFDNERAVEQGLASGDGTPVRFAFEGQDEAWIPVKVLGFDKPAAEVVVADLYLLTPGRPTILAGQVPGTDVVFQRDYRPDDLLVRDLLDDERADWIPTSFTLTRVDVRTEQQVLDFDLAARVDGVPATESAFGVARVADGDRDLPPLTFAGPAADATSPNGPPVVLLILVVLGLTGLAAGLVVARTR